MRPGAFLLCPLLALGCARADRIEIAPPALRFVGVGKGAPVHAAPYERNGRPIPDPPCTWSSSDEKVVRVAGRANDATVTSVGPGSASVRCTIGSAVGELPVLVRVVAHLSVRPERAELKVTDPPAPLLLEVDAVDDQGAPVSGRPPLVTCQDEAVCRGDGRGQVWPVGPGQTTARLEIEGAAATIPVRVVEGRGADSRPRAVKGNPMEELERKVRERERAAEAGKR